MPINGLLLDDHAVVRDGLQAPLATQPDIRTVGNFGDSRRAVAFARHASTPIMRHGVTSVE